MNCSKNGALILDGYCTISRAVGIFDPLLCLQEEDWIPTVKMGLFAADDVADSAIEAEESLSSATPPWALPRRTAPV